VFVFLDLGYPNVLSDARTWKGLLDHIALNLQMAHYGSSVQAVDGAHLRQAMDSNAGGVFVVPNGCMPNPIYDPELAWLRDWLNGGGTLIWFGDAFSYYHCSPGDRLLDLDPRVTGGWSPAEHLFGANLFEGLPKERPGALVAGPVSDALDVEYGNATRGAILPQLQSVGGQALGLIETGSPVGTGAVLDFGWGLGSDELTPASDIANLLTSRYLDTDHHVISFVQSSLPAQARRELRLAVPSGGTSGYALSVVSRDPYVVWSWHGIIGRAGA
jgi:hypothetical protein